jgi:phosphatidylinositol 4-kinase B
MQRRLALFNDERLFTLQLTNISNQLRLVQDRSKRKGELHRLLTELNEKFLLSKRVVFPLGTSGKPVDWIVQIVVDECSVFSSRERAPYSLICEVIRDDGCTYSDPTTTNLFLADGSLAVPLPDAASSKHARSSSAAAGGGGGNHNRTKSQELAGNDLLTEVFGETPSQRKHRIRASSVYGNHPRWDVASVIIKAGDDLRQEELALQIIDVFNKIWQEAGLTCMVVPYAAVSTTSDAGVIEMLTDSSSIDSIKKKAAVQSLHQFFVRAYGGEGSKSYALAQTNFIETMAGYSVVSFLVQIKDRHNGNLMLTRSGHLVHIDFGFMLATSPGGIKFESAPFKLSQELVDVMGGPNSTTFQYFKVLFFQGLKVAREHAEEIVALVELMTPYNTIACFGPDPNAVVQQMRDRLRFDLETDVEFAVYVKELIAISLDNWRTKKYDQFQTLQNGII